MAGRESIFEKHLKKELKNRYPGCIIIKLPSGLVQGIPDRLILFNDRWATLEVKRSATAPHRPNQDYYVERNNKMAFSRFIFPENEEEVLNDLDNYFLRR